MWNELEKSGDIYLSKYNGWYSVSDEAFYDEDETILENNKRISTISGSQVDWVEEESYFFRLSKWQDKLLDHFKKNNNFIMPNSLIRKLFNLLKKV